MKDETKTWLDYSRENLESATILLSSGLFNPCLQNIQQCVEKALKAVMIENSVKLKKTHSITELKNILDQNEIALDLSAEESEFLDSIYLPSKYPLNSVLPFYVPDQNICEQGIAIANKLFCEVKKILN